MWLRRAYFVWLVPAAFVLPLWLFIGWGVFQAGGWAFLWVLFLAIPSVFVGQLVLTLLVRLRPTVRRERAVSWWDVAGFTVWHLLTIALGFYVQSWWAPAMVLTVLVGIALFWSTIWQLTRDVRQAADGLRAGAGMRFVPPAPPRAASTDHGDHPVIVIAENDGRTP